MKGTTLARMLLVASVLALGAPGPAVRAGGVQPRTPTPGAAAPPCPARVMATQHLYPGSIRLRGIAAVSPTDVWATGDVTATTGLSETYLPLVEHYDGHTWCVVDAHSPSGVAAQVGTSVLWSAASATATWNERTWAQLAAVPDPTRFGLQALEWVAASSATNVWSAGGGGEGGYEDGPPFVERWDGSSWKNVPLPLAQDLIGQALGPTATLSVTDTWLLAGSGGPERSGAVVLHWNGRQWTRVPLPAPMTAGGCDLGSSGLVYLGSILALQHDDVWFGGAITPDRSYYCPLLLHWDGKSLQIVPALSAPRDGTLVGQAPVFAGDNNGWGISALAAVGPHDLWAIGATTPGMDYFALHYDGRNWHAVSVSLWLAVARMSAASTTDVWAVGESCEALALPAARKQCPPSVNAYHWDGKAWRAVTAIPAG